MSIYEWLWTRIGGRPWTYIIRDAWHRYEGLWIIGLVAGGAVGCHFFDLANVLIALGIFAAGYIAGHLFWGTPYIPDQPGGSPEPSPPADFHDPMWARPSIYQPGTGRGGGQSIHGFNRTAGKITGRDPGRKEVQLRQEQVPGLL